MCDVPVDGRLHRSRPLRLATSRAFQTSVQSPLPLSARSPAPRSCGRAASNAGTAGTRQDKPLETAAAHVSALDPAVGAALNACEFQGDPRQGAEKPLADRQRGNPLNLTRFAPA